MGVCVCVCVCVREEREGGREGSCRLCFVSVIVIKELLFFVVCMQVQ